jgi:hypothetical protein
MKRREKKQLLTCKICGTRFSETRDTIFLIALMTGIQSIALYGVSPKVTARETSRILGLSKDSAIRRESLRSRLCPTCRKT